MSTEFPRLVQAINNKNNIFLTGCGGSGKCLGIDTPIIMYDGSVKMVQDIISGEQLMGDDSTPRNVLSVCRGKEKMYKIHQKNRNDYIVNESHILSLRKNDTIYDIPLTTYLELNPLIKKELKGYAVSVEFPNRKSLDSSNFYKNKSYTLECAENPFFETEITVEPLYIDDYYGFEIDGNHRFLLGDFTVTHNTFCIGELSKLYNLSITSTTGVSAININGETIHRFSGIGALNPTYVFADILKKVKKNKSAVANIKNTEILVIDEISMLSADIIEILDKVFKSIKKSDKIFGGIQIIFTGDFYQLPPVQGDHCFLSDVWQNLKFQTITLTGKYRFTDNTYAELMDRVRIGKHSMEDIELLNTRYYAYKELNISEMEIQPTFVYTTNVNVDNHNLHELEKLTNEFVTYVAIDNCYDPESLNILKGLAPTEIKLKIGAQIMITANICVTEGLANGTRGVIQFLDDTYIKIKILNGQSVCIERHTYTYKNSSKEIYTREQFPIKLAWSMTVHKSQGASIDLAIIDLSYVFAASQVYVALSRVRSLDGLYITKKLKNKDIFVDENVKNFYDWYCC
jgi:hypothetical protein